MATPGWSAGSGHNMIPLEMVLELSKRVVAQILITEAGVTTDDGQLLSFLSDLLALVLHRTLRISASYANHANRATLSIFDVLKAFSFTRTGNLSQLLTFLSTRQVKSRGTGRAIPVHPPGRNLLKSAAEGEEDELESTALPKEKVPRPLYLTDIYPPFPRPYTFKRTETRGVRESDKVLIAKAKAEQQRQIESNLYRLLAKNNALREVINFDEDA